MSKSDGISDSGFFPGMIVGAVVVGFLVVGVLNNCGDLSCEDYCKEKKLSYYGHSWDRGCKCIDSKQAVYPR